MKLYYSPGACSMAAHILVNEWNIPCEFEKVDLKAHKTQDGTDFYRVNPKGYVPAMILDDGQLLTENIAILSYLNDRRNGVQGANYQFLEWLAFISTELHKGIGSLFTFTEPAVVGMIKDKVAKRLKIVDEKLVGEYLLQDEFSAADAYLVTILSWCRKFQIDLKPYSNISRYLERMNNRPSVQKTMKEEGLL
ncbi:MAG: glutathione S-transferase N-terminal domain-containing protein [Candidatus Omnitrophica bacterium]|nr:glutathione S-transferase N-terminal domain-containing protein [Candidatus Omnitrophota bacterium]